VRCTAKRASPSCRSPGTSGCSTDATIRIRPPVAAKSLLRGYSRASRGATPRPPSIRRWLPASRT
jgi:hypothetical protein